MTQQEANEILFPIIRAYFDKFTNSWERPIRKEVYEATKVKQFDKANELKQDL